MRLRITTTALIFPLAIACLALGFLLEKVSYLTQAVAELRSTVKTQQKLINSVPEALVANSFTQGQGWKLQSRKDGWLFFVGEDGKNTSPHLFFSDGTTTEFEKELKEQGYDLDKLSNGAVVGFTVSTPPVMPDREIVFTDWLRISSLSRSGGL